MIAMVEKLNNMENIVKYLTYEHKLGAEDFRIRYACMMGKIFLKFSREVDRNKVLEIVHDLQEKIPPTMRLIIEA